MNDFDDLTDVVIRGMISEPVGLGSDECVLWLTEHANCIGCPYELGCEKFAAMGVILLQAISYQPKDAVDLIKNSEQTARLLLKISEAETSDEVKTLVGEIDESN